MTTLRLREILEQGLHVIKLVSDERASLEHFLSAVLARQRNEREAQSATSDWMDSGTGPPTGPTLIYGSKNMQVTSQTENQGRLHLMDGSKHLSCLTGYVLQCICDYAKETSFQRGILMVSDVPNERSDEVVVEDRIGNENITEENIVVLDVAPDDLEVIHDPSTLPSTSSNTRNTTQASKPSRRVLWTKKTDSSPSSIPEFTPSDVEASNSSDSDTYLGNPVWYFKKFFTPDFLDKIVHQSNLYATQKNVNKPLNLSREELEQWLGLLIHFSIIRTP
ncbi:hypothetical protein GWK47_040340 [Chionoecetes opilio]|uniref:PiggyBac transposable element-derived protein domain-containing protein n=1 Tax=Chionoecetes opilio TaxID=41210 RepID=A0A8J5D0Z0_CHIOP|nr:hypothetical protein GWK47_040340 [Chionoecetes opilio]